LAVTPTVAGTEQFTLTCGGNNHSDATASATLTVNAGTAFTRTSLTFDVDAGMASCAINTQPSSDASPRRMAMIEAATTG
jgi:hypothetical protein